MAGNFTYGATTVNVLNLAAANGQVSTPDPTIAKILQEIQATTSTGSIQTIDANLNRFSFNVPTQSVRHYPTFRLDYNVNSANRASFAYNYQKFTDYPDTLNNREYSFPGFPAAAGQASVRLGWSGSVRSTLKANLVNEARLGYTGAPVHFFDEFNTGMFTGSSVNQAGFSLRFPTVTSQLTSPAPVATPSSRNANSLLVENTLTWLKGAHSVSVGGTFTQYDIWAKDSMLIPQITFGLSTNDPAAAMFSAANFPGISSANLTAVQNLYALLTGRVAQIAADARLDEKTGQYQFVGTGLQRGRLREGGVYLADELHRERGRSVRHPVPVLRAEQPVLVRHHR